MCIVIPTRAKNGGLGSLMDGVMINFISENSVNCEVIYEMFHILNCGVEIK